MSNRDALRKLSRKFPAPPEIKLLLDALQQEPDRAAAIVGAGLLETALERVIIKSLKHSAPSLVGALFENRGPMSDFRSKILVAHAFGILSPVGADELHSVRFIRNAFAHSRINLTFETPEIAKELRSSAMLGVIEKTSSDLVKDADEKTRKAFKMEDSKRRFLLIVRLLFIVLDHQLQGLGGDPLEAKDKASPSVAPQALT